MNKDSKNDYKKSLEALRTIFNSVDPEGLEPGKEDGSPIDEYDDEIARIYSFVIHNVEDVKINKSLLVAEINKIWKENFGSNCDDAVEVANRIIKELF